MHFYWPGMTDFVPTHIRECPDCLARKSPNNRREPMGHVPVSSKWERVAMDIFDITTISDKGNRYILVVADYCTKYIEAYALKNKSSRSVVDALAEHDEIWFPTDSALRSGSRIRE